MKRHIQPLVVDLDGTLIKSDILLESFYSALRCKPLLIFQVPFWLLKGKAFLKTRLAEFAVIDPQTLPYHKEFLNFLIHEHNQGRILILATASLKKYADAIAGHLGIFTEVLATDREANLKGKNKLKVLIEKYGDKGFDYAGDDPADLHIFPHAKKSILVGASPSTVSAARSISDIDKIFLSESKFSFKKLLKAMRLYQWVKNALMFVPLMTSHNWDDHSVLLQLALGFLSFGMCASSGYIFNDLLDLNADRQHPRKRNRPFANGDISIWQGSALIVILQVFGLAIAAFLNKEFLALIIIYSALSLAYTLHLKTYVLIDVLVLASLYTARIVAGSILAEAPLSFWLFAFSIFIFFSLALVKRCSELFALAKTNRVYAGGRDYSVSDSEYLREMGIASGYMAILIVALYINSPDVSVLYKNPKMLWLICPVLFYWVSRIWLKTGRGEMHDDPIVFSIKDKGSRFVVFVMVLIVLLAI